MFIRTFDGLAAAGMVKTSDTGIRSGRYLTAADHLGFSYNDNRIGARAEMTLWYNHHWEARGRGGLQRRSEGPAPAARR